MSAKMIITINPETGESSIRAEGYTGSTCKEKTRPFERALGVVTKDDNTSEAYTDETQNETEKQF